MRPQPDLRSDLCPLLQHVPLRVQLVPLRVRLVAREKPAQRFSIPSPASPVNPSSHLGMVELLPPRIVPSTISQLPGGHGALALGGAVSANINPSSHVSMVEFGAAAAMIGLSIPALTWGRCSRLCRTPYHGRPEYGSFLNFVWLNKPCEATPRIRMPLRWRAES